jgi:hypothetical protein
MTVKDKLRQEIEVLSDQMAEEVYCFVRFIEVEKEKEKFTGFAQKVSEQSFQHIWDNQEDAAYDKL